VYEAIAKDFFILNEREEVEVRVHTGAGTRWVLAGLVLWPCMGGIQLKSQS
jgi:hypothetical protein